MFITSVTVVRDFFEMPSVLAFCIDCSQTFSFNDLNWLDLYVYEPTSALFALKSRLLLIPSIKRELVKRGFTIKNPSSLVGASKVIHEFDILAKKEDKLVGIDVRTSTGKERKEDLLSSFVKTSDFDSNEVHVTSVHTEKLTEEERDISKRLGLHIIESTDVEKIVEKVEEAVDEMIKRSKERIERKEKEKEEKLK